jgi:hypothetical protein
MNIPEQGNLTMPLKIYKNGQLAKLNHNKALPKMNKGHNDR